MYDIYFISPSLWMWREIFAYFQNQKIWIFCISYNLCIDRCFFFSSELFSKQKNFAIQLKRNERTGRKDPISIWYRNWFKNKCNEGNLIFSLPPPISLSLSLFRSCFNRNWFMMLANISRHRENDNAEKLKSIPYFSSTSTSTDEWCSLYTVHIQCIHSFQEDSIQKRMLSIRQIRWFYFLFFFIISIQMYWR